MAPSALPPVVGAVHDAVASVDGFNNVLSEAAVARWLGSGDAAVGGAVAIPQRFRSQFRTADGSAFLVTAHMPATPAAATRERLERLEDALAPVQRQYDDYAVSVTGIVPLGAIASDSLIAGLKQSLALAVVITIGVIALSVGSVTMALLAAVLFAFPTTAPQDEATNDLVELLRSESKNPVVYAELPKGQHNFDLFHSFRSEAVVDGIEAFAAWVRSRKTENAGSKPPTGRGDASRASPDLERVR